MPFLRRTKDLHGMCTYKFNNQTPLRHAQDHRWRFDVITGQLHPEGSRSSAGVTIPTAHRAVPGTTI